MERKHFSHGFIMGLILGVLLTLLFTTKRGRRIVKMLSEEGTQSIARLEELFEEKRDTPVKENKERQLDSEEKDEFLMRDMVSVDEKKEPVVAKRLFKGIPRRKASHSVN